MFDLFSSGVKASNLVGAPSALTLLIHKDAEMKFMRFAGTVGQPHGLEGVET
jgi:hypothetical protein